jgi:DNA-binding protein HU-beta
MKKADLIAAVAEEMNTNKHVADEALDALSKVLQRQLVAGEALLIPGIGTFSVIQKAARLGRNPKTGDTVEIAAKKSVKFKATKTLADAVNE